MLLISVPVMALDFLRFLAWSKSMSSDNDPEDSEKDNVMDGCHGSGLI